MSFKQEEAALKNTLYPGHETRPAAAMRLGERVRERGRYAEFPSPFQGEDAVVLERSESYECG